MKLILYIGVLLIVLAAAMPILDVAPFLAPYAMIAGSLCFGYALWHEQRGKQADVTVRRLYRIQTLGSLAFLASGVFMLLDSLDVEGVEGSFWQATLAIGAALHVYTSFRLPNTK